MFIVQHLSLLNSVIMRPVTKVKFELSVDKKLQELILACVRPVDLGYVFLQYMTPFLTDREK